MLPLVLENCGINCFLKTNKCLQTELDIFLSFKILCYIFVLESCVKYPCGKLEGFVGEVWLLFSEFSLITLVEYDL